MQEERRTKLSDDAQCPHYTIIRIPSRVEPSDPIALPRICLKCGAAFIMYPLKLKDHPGLEKKLQEFAKEATGNIKKL